jgi:hypothetical protein
MVQKTNWQQWPICKPRTLWPFLLRGKCTSENNYMPMPPVWYIRLHWPLLFSETESMTKSTPHRLNPQCERNALFCLLSSVCPQTMFHTSFSTVHYAISYLMYFPKV